jgi:hypothetical protein
MSSIIRRFALAVVILGAVGGLPIGETQAMACPNCKAGNETDPLKPKAYMYSILFMIGMPATIFTGFSLSFWRMTKKAQQEQLAAMANDEESGDV